MNTRDPKRDPLRSMQIHHLGSHPLGIERGRAELVLATGSAREGERIYQAAAQALPRLAVPFSFLLRYCQLELAAGKTPDEVIKGLTRQEGSQ